MKNTNDRNTHKFFIAHEKTQCQGVSKFNKPCKRIVMDATGRCWQHWKL